MDFSFRVAGDQSVLVVFGDEISDEISRLVRTLAEIIDSKQITGIEEVILGYTNLLVNYNPIILPYQNLLKTIEACIHEIDLTEAEHQELIELPVFYGEELGPDLEDVARLNNLTPEEVIQIHSEPIYPVYFLGFTPGFPFLGGLSERIATPRLDSPRVKIRGGSVGIANNQTGIYPVSSPGGWRLIGHTPIPLYNPKSEKPFLLSSGNLLKFKPISREEYEEIKHNTNLVKG